jgi:prefoldin beta subunit
MSQQRIPPEVQQLLTQYQVLRDNYVKLDSELRVIEAELVEIDQVLDTLKNTSDDTEVYKIVGHVLIKKKKDEIVNELQERKELLNIKKEKYKNQLSVLEKQISDLDSKIKETLAKYGINIGQ